MRIVKSVKDIDCIKNIAELDDGYYIEYCFKYPFWICVTTQVGCPIGCKFCYSGKNGLKRNLRFDEMLYQVESAIEMSTKEKKIPFLTISFTGMGEPLLNTDNVIKMSNYAIENYNCKILLTTTGIIEELQKMVFLREKIYLDISVHSLNHQTREQLIPFEKINPISNTISYVCKNRKRFEKVTLDYMLLGGVNDSDNDIEMIIENIRGKDVCVELKKYNRHTREDYYMQPDEQKFSYFYSRLQSEGIQVTIEQNVGLNIKAGCGQLVWDFSRRDNI